MSQLTTFTKAQKAAAILVAMGKPSAAKLLKFFKQEELKALVDAARVLRTIPQAELEKIVAEFEAEFTEGAGLLDSSDKMDTLVSEHLSPEEMNALMGKPSTKAGDQSASVWEQLEAVTPDRLAAFVASEHPQTTALVLSKLSPPLAAKVVVLLDKAVRGEVVKRMVSLGQTSPAALRILENRLRAQVLAESAGKDTSAGHSRVASLLNELDKDALDEVMDDLAATGSRDVEAIRARLFSFEDIALLSQRSRVSLFDGVSTELVTLALRGAPGPLAEAVLSAIGARSRRMIEAELASGGENVPADEILKARKQIASTALRLAQEGVVELPNLQQAA
ncbi:MAG TPA: flagellar motor switch protein FliG [Tianweitania sediminis]|jgi:flagellar motor switch protein FliG|nr:flagellar motor switch protein FliG [Tianweitania sediminis]